MFGSRLLSGLDLRLRARGRTQQSRRRTGYRPSVAAAASLLESRCLLSSGGVAANSRAYVAITLPDNGPQAQIFFLKAVPDGKEDRVKIDRGRTKTFQTAEGTDPAKFKFVLRVDASGGKTVTIDYKGSLQFSLDPSQRPNYDIKVYTQNNRNVLELVRDPNNPTVS